MVAKKYQNPSGGLNEAGRKYFKRTTGANLKRPSKKVGNKRRASFLQDERHEEKLTSAKTANDPNSRINKALRLGIASLIICSITMAEIKNTKDFMKAIEEFVRNILRILLKEKYLQDL